MQTCAWVKMQTVNAERRIRASGGTDVPADWFKSAGDGDGHQNTLIKKQGQLDPVLFWYNVYKYELQNIC